MIRRLAERIEPHLDPLRNAAVVTGGAGLLLGFLASIDVLLLPRGEPIMAWLLHPLLLGTGLFGGLTTAISSRAIDRRRWEILDEPLLTEGEREHAHKEAERERRAAGTWFLLAPVLLGYWMAYQFAGEEGGSPLTYLLTATPMAGFPIGLLLANRALGPEEPPF